MTSRTQQARTETANTPPANNSLLPGQIYLELADPVRVWAGVPTSLASSGQKLLFDASSSNALLKTGDTATGLIVFGAGVHVTALPATFDVSVTARGAILGAPTGGSAGDMGVGTVNVSTGYYQNGVSIGTGPFLPLAGGNCTGPVGATGYQTRPGTTGAFSGHTHNIDWTGSLANLWIDNSNIGAIAVQGWVGANYLSLSGGTLSGPGNLTVNGALNVTGGTTTNTLTVTTGTATVGGATIATQSWVGSQGYATQGQLGGYLPLSGGTLSNPGNLTVSGGLQVNGQIVTYNQIWCGSDVIIPNGRWYYCKDTAGNAQKAVAVDGNNQLLLGDGSRNVWINPSSTCYINGAIYMTGGLQSTMNIVANGLLYCGGTGGPYWWASSGYMRTDSCGKSAGWLPTADNGSSNGLTGQAWSQVASYWFNNVSARQLKTDIKQVTDAHALAQVMKLRPSTFHWKEEGWHEPGKRIERKRHVGFIADEVAQALGHDFGGYNVHEGVEGLNYAELVATLWAAVRALAAKVEGKHGAI